MRARAIMVQGTGSHVGKSVIVAGLCRVFRDDGYAVCPYKAQNMAHSWVTPDGDEMGLAQAAQAQAARVAPRVEMNPVLLKPETDTLCQVIVMGKPVGTMSGAEYLASYASRAARAAREALRQLMRSCEVVVIEGAGSPAEVNLRRQDFANMRTARWARAPVLLVADIDRGGALAAVVGTLELLEEEERRRVAGIVINKFRGDPDVLRPGLLFLEARTGRRVLGVIPYVRGIGIPDEDSLGEEVGPGRGELSPVTDGAYDAFARVLRRDLDMGSVYGLLGLPGPRRARTAGEESAGGGQRRAAKA